MPEEVTQPTIEDLTPSNAKAPAAKPIPKKTIPLKKPTSKKPEYKTISEPQAPIQKLKPTYKYAGKESLAKILRKSIPKQFIPTERFASILGLIFLAVVLLALFQFPFSKLLSGDTSIIIGIGYPLHFLELGIETATESPLRPLGLFLDIMLYLILAYTIDIVINLITDTRIIKSKEELKKQPKVFKNKKPSAADKMTQKVFAKNKK